MGSSDFYTVIHKHVRRVLFDTSVRLGGLDRTNVASVIETFRGIAGMLHGHASHEEELLGPMLREVATDLSRELLASHQALDQQIAAIEKQMQRLATLDDGFDEVALGVYRAFNLFLADYLHHLDDEETRLFPALGARNPEASAAAGMIVEDGVPTRLLEVLLPILAHAERVEVLRPLCGEKQVLERAMQMARNALTSQQVAALEKALATA